MAIRVIWGFGGIEIAAINDFSESVFFDHTTGRLEFIQEYNEYITESRVLRRVFKGWRPRITCRIYNTGCPVTNGNDYDEIRHLIDIVNYARRTGESFYVRPRHDTDFSSDSLYYQCELTSDSFIVEDGSPTAAFQTLDLEFRGVSLVDSIPNYMTGGAAKYWTSQTPDSYVDQAGNKFTMVN